MFLRLSVDSLVSAESFEAANFDVQPFVLLVEIGFCCQRFSSSVSFLASNECVLDRAFKITLKYFRVPFETVYCLRHYFSNVFLDNGFRCNTLPCARCYSRHNCCWVKPLNVLNWWITFKIINTMTVWEEAAIIKLS